MCSDTRYYEIVNSRILITIRRYAFCAHSLPIGIFRVVALFFIFTPRDREQTFRLELSLEITRTVRRYTHSFSVYFSYERTAAICVSDLPGKTSVPWRNQSQIAARRNQRFFSKTRRNNTLFENDCFG